MSSVKNKKSKNKIMLVDEQLAKDVERLSSKMQTSPADVVVTALELLKLTLGREVIIRKSKSNKEILLPIFKSIEPEINLEDDSDE